MVDMDEENDGDHSNKDPGTREAHEQHLNRGREYINEIHPNNTEAQNGDKTVERGKRRMSKCLQSGIDTTAEPG